jgi:hypothetical protein
MGGVLSWGDNHRGNLPAEEDSRRAPGEEDSHTHTERVADDVGVAVDGAHMAAQDSVIGQDNEKSRLGYGAIDVWDGTTMAFLPAADPNSRDAAGT